MASKQNMAMVLQALKNAGLSDNQARILGAEIGRENAFQDKYLWGYHSDPKNKAINIGIISWQGNRGRNVEKALRDAGLFNNGKITKGQDSLNVMAKYLIHEIRSNPAYAETKNKFLNNPNVDYHTGTKVLGKNFIRWRYDDPAYASGHRNRDKYYAQLGGIAPASGPSAAPSPQVGANDYLAHAANFQPSTSVPVTSMLNQNSAVNNPVNLLSGSVGVVAPESSNENKLFGVIGNMNLGADLERIYAEAARAISQAKDSVESRDMLQFNNPLRKELGALFDLTEL